MLAYVPLNTALLIQIAGREGEGDEDMAVFYRKFENLSNLSFEMTRAYMSL